MLNVAKNYVCAAVVFGSFLLSCALLGTFVGAGLSGLYAACINSWPGNTPILFTALFTTLLGVMWLLQRFNDGEKSLMEILHG